MSVKEAVSRGVKFLDYFHPGWKDKIDVDTLDMSDACQCIIGQLYGDYCKNPLPTEQCYEYGFSIFNNDYMSKLTDEWKSRLIETFDLSEVEVSIGEYIVVDSNQRGFLIDDVVYVLETKGIEFERFRNDNIVRNNFQVYISPNIIVTPKKS